MPSNRKLYINFLESLNDRFNLEDLASGESKFQSHINFIKNDKNFKKINESINELINDNEIFDNYNLILETVENIGHRLGLTKFLNKGKVKELYEIFKMNLIETTNYYVSIFHKEDWFQDGFKIVKNETIIRFDEYPMLIIGQNKFDKVVLLTILNENENFTTYSNYTIFNKSNLFLLDDFISSKINYGELLRMPILNYLSLNDIDGNIIHVKQNNKPFDNQTFLFEYKGIDLQWLYKFLYYEIALIWMFIISHEPNLFAKMNVKLFKK